MEETKQKTLITKGWVKIYRLPKEPGSDKNEGEKVNTDTLVHKEMIDCITFGGLVKK